MNCVDLARTLVRFPSLNPPGEEKAAADYVANLLEQAGLEVKLHEFAPGRPSMVARLRGASDLHLSHSPDISTLCRWAKSPGRCRHLLPTSAMASCSGGVPAT